MTRPRLAFPMVTLLAQGFRAHHVSSIDQWSDVPVVEQFHRLKVANEALLAARS